MSSVFNDSEELYRTTVYRWLVHRPHYSARLMRFGSRGPSEFFSPIRHRNALTKIAWEEAEQGLGGNVYSSVIEKQGIVAGIVVYWQRVLQTVTSLGVVSLRPPENHKFYSPARSLIFALEEISSPRERRKWSLGLGHNLKALGLTCVRSQSSREINNATTREFSTFLEINKSREQFLLRLTLFYPIYG